MQISGIVGKGRTRKVCGIVKRVQNEDLAINGSGCRRDLRALVPYRVLLSC